MANPHGHGDDHIADHAADHGPTEDPSRVIKDGSPQDWLLVLVGLLACLSLTWYGFQWANTAVVSAESSETASPEHSH